MSILSGILAGVKTPRTLTLEDLKRDGEWVSGDQPLTPKRQMRLQESIAFFTELYERGEFLPIYRGLRLRNFNDLRLDKLGIYWSYDRDCTRPVGDLLEDGEYSDRQDYRWYLFEGVVHRDSVNWAQTIVQGMSYGILPPEHPEGDPNEQTMQERTGGWLLECEVTLKRGAKVKLLGWAEKRRFAGDDRDEPYHPWGPTQPFPKPTVAFAGTKK